MSFNNSSSKLFSSNTLANPTTPFYGGSGGNPFDWANYPAISDVNMNSFDINNLDKINNAQEVSAGLLYGVTTTTRTVSSASQPFTLLINGDSGTNTHVLTADGTGNCSWVAPSGGGVTSVSGTPNEIAVTSGTTPVVSLAAPSPAPTAGAYTNANITVDGFGRVTSAANGSSGGITSIQSQTGPAINLTSVGATISITTPAANTINLETLGSGGVTSLNGSTGVVTIVGTGAPNDVTVSGNLVNPIVITAPGIATAIADAATAQAAANAAQTTANTALANAATAAAAAATADATALGAAAAAATANAGVATILSSYVTQITAGSNISISPTGGTGNVTINSTGGGGVTSVTGTANQIGVTAGPTPVVSLAVPSPAPTAGAYTNANITVDGFGRVVAASNGGGGGSSGGQLPICLSSNTASSFTGFNIPNDGNFYPLPNSDLAITYTSTTTKMLISVTAQLQVTLTTTSNFEVDFEVIQFIGMNLNGTGFPVMSTDYSPAEQSAQIRINNGVPESNVLTHSFNISQTYLITNCPTGVPTTFNIGWETGSNYGTTQTLVCTGAQMIAMPIEAGGVGFVDALQIYVAPNGDNTTGNGSQQNPYLTIAKALTQRATLSNASEVSIILSSGTYTESFTLTRNTFLVGVQTGESRQPCNVTGTITMNDTTGSMGLSGLEIVGNVTTSGIGGSYSIFGCNISSSGTAITATTGTVFITECRISNTASTTITSSATLTIRDCVVSTSGTGSCVNGSAATTIRQSVITSSSASTGVQPLVTISNTNPAVIEISFCKLEYLSTVTDVTGNKCCVKFAGSNTATASVFDNLFLCEGAITGSPQIQCIQDTGAGAVNISFGNLKAGLTATHISPSATKTVYNTVT